MSDERTAAQIEFDSQAGAFLGSTDLSRGQMYAVRGMAMAAMERAEELRTRADESIASANTVICQYESLSAHTTERLDALAKESANNQIELAAHAKALDAHGDRIQSIKARTDACVASLAGLLEGKPPTAHKSEPSIRVRISHAHTLKDGWRCDSTTVEYDGPLSGFDETVITEHLQMAAVLGAREANLRNAPQAAGSEDEVPW